MLVIHISLQMKTFYTDKFKGNTCIQFVLIGPHRVGVRFWECIQLQYTRETGLLLTNKDAIIFIKAVCVCESLCQQISPRICIADVPVKRKHQQNEKLYQHLLKR